MRKLHTALVVIVAIIAVHPCALSQEKDNVQIDSRSPGISLQGLLRFFEKYKGGTVSEAMVIKLIDMYGLDFRPTLEDLMKLRTASASEDLVRAIETARKPPAPKPVSNLGHLAVSCQPVDCEVWLDGNPAGKTSHGLLPVITRPQGAVIITATRDSYEPMQGKQEALIRPNELVRLEFKFQPSHAALVTAGAALLQQMANSLGPEATEMTTFRATGTLYLQDSNGYRTAWSLVEWAQRPEMARFELNRLREKCQVTRTATGFVWQKRPKTTEAQKALEEAIQLVMDSQLKELVKTFGDSGVTAVAADLTFGIDNPAAFRVEGGPTIYAVTLDSANRPSEIKVESSDRAGLRMLYSDYAQQEKYCYPKNTQIIRPDGVSGVEARLEFLPMDTSPASRRKPRIFRR